MAMVLNTATILLVRCFILYFTFFASTLYTATVRGALNSIGLLTCIMFYNVGTVAVDSTAAAAMPLPLLLFLKAQGR